MAENMNITPDMINNLMNMLKNSSEKNSTSQNTNNNENFKNFESVFKNFASQSKTSNNNNNNNNNSFNSNSSSSNTSNPLGNMDFETIMKFKNIIDTINSKDDPDSKLLYSLKPYLRKSRQEKLDQYVNLLKISHASNIFNKNSKGV